MARNLIELFSERVTSTPAHPAYMGRVGEGWSTLTWQEVSREVTALAAALRALGVTRGDRVGLLAQTRVKWALADIATLHAGGATTTLYPSSTPEDCAWVLGDSDAVVCFVESVAQLNKIVQVRSALPALKHAILLDGDSPLPWVLSWKKAMAMGEAALKETPQVLEVVAAELGPRDLATLIYTSGTTGRPKGVRLTHDCWVSMAESSEWIKRYAGEDELQYIFLPLAHSFGKALLFGAIYTGTLTALDGDIGAVRETLPVLRPTFVAAVPRVFEKIFNGVVSQARAKGPRAYQVFRWAVSVGREISQVRQAGGEPRGLLALRGALADRLVFSKIRQGMGGRLRFFVSGGAPLSVELAEFFHAADMLILEGYGLTESSAASVANRPDDYRFGTVGKPLDGVELSLADDGEVLLRGRSVMQGYHGRPDATAEVLDADGWLHTGDIGALDGDGFLRITDRKKDIIITAGGKNVAPQPIEAALRAACPLLSHVVLHGDRRNFCVALVCVDGEAAQAWAAQRALTAIDYAGLASLPELREEIEAAVEEVNARLASFETIKGFAILDHELSVERGELTAKMSVRRRVVERDYKAALDAFYVGELETL